MDAHGVLRQTRGQQQKNCTHLLQYAESRKFRSQITGHNLPEGNFSTSTSKDSSILPIIQRSGRSSSPNFDVSLQLHWIPNCPDSKFITGTRLMQRQGLFGKQKLRLIGNSSLPRGKVNRPLMRNIEDGAKILRRQGGPPWSPCPISNTSLPIAHIAQNLLPVMNKQLKVKRMWSGEIGPQSLTTCSRRSAVQWVWATSGDSLTWLTKTEEEYDGSELWLTAFTRFAHLSMNNYCTIAAHRYLWTVTKTSTCEPYPLGTHWFKLVHQAINDSEFAPSNSSCVGINMVIQGSILSISYSCIVAYSLYYLFASFQSPLPWSDCFSWWGADETCSRTPKDPLCNLTLDDGYFKIVSTTWLQAKNKICPNGSEISVPFETPSVQYWNKVVLQRSSSIEETGNIVWYLALCLLLTWLIVVGALSKGIKSSGKVVYFTVTFPYLFLTILLIQGLTLEGAYKGIDFYIGSQSDFSKLADAGVWKDAAVQIFYSCSVGSGFLITLSSYNKFHNDCYRDTIIVCIINCATSLLAGFVIFSTLGHIAHVQNKTLAEIAQSDYGLVFTVYPEAVSQLPWAPLWSILFFITLLLMGIDSLFAFVEKILTCMMDRFPKYLRPKRFSLTIGICMLVYLLGLVSVTEAGIYWINLIDHFSIGWVPIITTLQELIAVSSVYGVNRFIKDIEMMIGARSWYFWLWWKLCWFFISPFALTITFFWSLMTFIPPKYESVQYPVWAIALGWCLIILSVIWVPIVAVVTIIKANGSTLYQKFSAACASSPDWGPYLEQHRGERYRKRPVLSEAQISVESVTL
ncbi:sodium- and chloride-dependent neutral and basic amino acid transporter B(0+)-like [Stegostoma tigrinum]|uniref:sodium- and chloride-dependent neutral and basic amino acid transporter B(0+)-like n=1 Tax=Stegostoma tigrinum TaxID=3053191 RepID=UPI00286FAF81|nr:sodium- and chloride-dependent neutral and basic amino acid transporter B(0+)-like [Stegostoma tigrinum]